MTLSFHPLLLPLAAGLGLATNAHAGPAPSELIVADADDAPIGSLLQGATHPVVGIDASEDALRRITDELGARRQAGTAVTTLHVVAHGRAGAVKLGDEWIDVADLAAAGPQLATWSLDDIVVWGCDVGDAPAFADELEALTGARIWTSTEPLGQGHWLSLIHI